MIQPILLSGAGILSRVLGQSQIDSERRRLRLAELLRQRAYGERARGALNQTIEALSDPGADYETAAATRSAAMVTPESVATAPVVASAGSTPEAVRKAMARTLSSILTKGRGEIKAGARAGAAGAQLEKYKKPISESGREIGMMQNFSEGSARALASEMEQAQQSGQGLMTIGDILSGVGTIYGLQNIGMTNPLSYPVGDAYGPAINYYARRW